VPGDESRVLDIGVATGVFGSELTVPYYVFLDAGRTVDVASPRGGPVPVDPLSMDGEHSDPGRRSDALLGVIFGREILSRVPAQRLNLATYFAWVLAVALVFMRQPKQRALH